MTFHYIHDYIGVAINIYISSFKLIQMYHIEKYKKWYNFVSFIKICEKKYKVQYIGC